MNGAQAGPDWSEPSVAPKAQTADVVVQYLQDDSSLQVSDVPGDGEARRRRSESTGPAVGATCRRRVCAADCGIVRIGKSIGRLVPAQLSMCRNEIGIPSARKAHRALEEFLVLKQCPSSFPGFCR